MIEQPTEDDLAEIQRILSGDRRLDSRIVAHSTTHVDNVTVFCGEVFGPCSGRGVSYVFNRYGQGWEMDIFKTGEWVS